MKNEKANPKGVRAPFGSLLNRRWLVLFLLFFAALLSIFAGAYLRLIPTRLAEMPYYDM